MVRRAKMIRRTVAATMPTTIAWRLLARQTCCGETDDNGIVSRQCQSIMMTWRRAAKASCTKGSCIKLLLRC